MEELKRGLVDRRGRSMRLVLYSSALEKGLKRFYEEFEPKGEFQGIPPTRKRERRAWLTSLLKEWVNYLVLYNERVIAHVAVDLLQRPEMPEVTIFVHQGFRGHGIGTQAMKLIAEDLKERGYGKLWLTVSNDNVPAIRCFKKVGFSFVNPMEPEREMILDLRDQGGNDPGGLDYGIRLRPF